MRAIFEVAVVGGGPAGAVAALALCQAGAGVVLLESQPAPSWKIGETLAPEGRVVLRSLGLLEDFLAGGHLASPGICSAWGQEALATTDFVFHPHGNGWQLDRRAFEALLLERAAAAGAEVRMSARVEQVRRKSGTWRLQTSAGELRSAVLVDSTGRRSMLARQLGTSRAMLDRLVSIYAVASQPNASDRDRRTLVESGPDGWWYSALMPNGRRIVAWQTEADSTRAQAWREQDWFRQKIAETRHLGALLTAHRYTFEGAPRLTSAQSARLREFVGDGWLAVGDAAMSLDPLSGMGILKALKSGRKAALALLGRDAETPQTYAQWNEALWTEYLGYRKDYYSLERRWPERPFWRDRQS